MSEYTVVINGSSLVLDKKTNIEVLRAYINKGYSVGCFTIKNGSELLRCFKALAGDSEHIGGETNTYKSILKSLEFANSKGAFTLDDSENLNTVFEYTLKQLE
jgi:hypothetical protein